MSKGLAQWLARCVRKLGMLLSTTMLLKLWQHTFRWYCRATLLLHC